MAQPVTTDSLRPPPAGDLLALGVAVIFIALSGPFIAATAAPVLAIAFWRCLIGSGLTGLWVVLRDRRSIGALTKRELRLIAIAGVFLGLHFATWIPSLAFTSVAASTALVATQPIWAAFIARARGVRIPPAAWLGIFIALAGVIFLTGVDVQLDSRHLIGDLLALAGAVFAAAYVSVGERVRQTVSTATMTFLLYGVAAVTVLPLLAIFQQELVGFSAQAWLMILAITLGAQLLGHTLMNKVLARSSATFVSLTILLEMPGAAIVAAIWLGQTPPPAIYPAAALILLGIVIVIRSSSRIKEPLETSPI
ncbi:MAG: DMT family transporter [Candidatus Nanopelagicales bacterium]|nr:DMT family transporter [Candidatus Nanopelagicales bacterium]MCF8540058.1 DMT family transporter [Candidatus Nanopelagicales bacterium]